MMKISIDKVLEVTKGKLLSGNKNDFLGDIIKDSREIKKGDTYIGIRGENFDGNIFYKDAIRNGATTCILDRVVDSEFATNINIILVEDSIEALQKIAEYIRDNYNLDVIAITGSVGKTSTKDIIANVISQEYSTLKTQGNLNGQIGLPLTIMRLNDKYEKLVIEMGMSKKGEISKLTKIVKPKIAVITNIGTSHIGNLGSRENILKAKMEILEQLQGEGTVIINNDNDLLHKWAIENKYKYNIITYGIKNESDYMAKNIKYDEYSSEFDVVINNVKYRIIVPVGGEHFVYNSLCAISVGCILNISIEKIKKGIREFELTKRRMEIIDGKYNCTIINDCYNANYDSMKAAIEYLSRLKDKRKIAVLGDMLELGEFSQELHKSIGDIVSKCNIDKLITVGTEAKNIADTAVLGGMNKSSVYYASNNKEAIEILDKIIKDDEYFILVKASNGMKFNQIIDEIKND